MALYAAGQREEAVATYRRALRLSPKSTSLRTRLVGALVEDGYWNEAAAECRHGLEVDPAGHLPLWRLATNLIEHGRVEEAVVAFRKVIEMAPDFADAHHLLGSVYLNTARYEDAVTELRKAKELRAPPLVNVTLARALAATGRWEEAIAALQAAADVGEPTNPTYLVAIGNVLRSHGKAEEAAAAFQKAADRQPQSPPGWEGLAAARLDQGRFAEARAAIKSALALPHDDVGRRAQRRQLDLCESLLAIDANLPAVLAGKERPTDVPTQRALAEWCLNHKQLPAMAAGFYASAFATQPSLADDLEAGHRFNAARAAVLAGCGAGADAARLDDRRRAELRKQALDWLTTEYNTWAERHRRGRPGDRTVAATAVRFWLTSGGRVDLQLPRATVRDFDARAQAGEDLAGVRDEQALAKLPPDERSAWQALWAKVATLAARDPAAKFDHARAHAARLEWKNAAKCYAEGMELEPTQNGDVWFEYAAAQLLAGDRTGYRRACAHMLARGQGPGSMRSYLVARACTLAPDSTEDSAQPFRVSATELASHSAEFWALTEEAALIMRSGQFQLAVLYSERSLAADGRPGRAVVNWLWLALAYQKLGNPKEARRWLDKAANWLDQQGGRMPRESSVMGSHLHNWLEAHVLRREAEALLR
jgi:tetratricopeptide (TPR) repeat protein